MSPTEVQTEVPAVDLAIPEPNKQPRGPVVMTSEEEEVFRVETEHDAAVADRLKEQDKRDERRGVVNLIPLHYDVPAMIAAERAADVYRVWRQSLALDDPRRDDRHVLALILALKMTSEGPRALVPAWETIQGNLVNSDKLFRVDRDSGTPRGRLLLSLIARTRKVGPHSWVGTFSWQREILAARELGIKREHALSSPEWSLVWIAMILDTAVATMREQWGHLSPDELLDLARRHKLNLVAVKMTDRFIQTVEKVETEQRVDLGEGDYSEEADRRGEDLASLGEPWDWRPVPNRWGPDHASDRRGTVDAALLEEVLALEQAIALAPTETIRRRLREYVEVVIGWPGPGKPPERYVADKMGLSPGRVKQLKAIGRSLRESLLDESAPASRRSERER